MTDSELWVLLVELDNGDVGRDRYVYGPFGSEAGADASVPDVVSLWVKRGYRGRDVDVSVDAHMVRTVGEADV